MVIDEVAGQLLALSFTVIPLWRHDVPDLAVGAWPAGWRRSCCSACSTSGSPGWSARADRRGDAAGVMLDDLWAGLFRRGRLGGAGGAVSRAGAAMAGMKAAEDVLKRARFWGLTIATAESCTGGMVAAALTDVPGSSDVFDRGFVTYSNAAKMQMLGVSPETLAGHGAVSEPVVREMARRRAGSGGRRAGGGDQRHRGAGRQRAQARGAGLLCRGQGGPADLGRDGRAWRHRPRKGAPRRHRPCVGVAAARRWNS